MILACSSAASRVTRRSRMSRVVRVLPACTVRVARLSQRVSFARVVCVVHTCRRALSRVPFRTPCLAGCVSCARHVVGILTTSVYPFVYPSVYPWNIVLTLKYNVGIRFAPT
jgi:hypothetical protein